MNKTIKLDGLRRPDNQSGDPVVSTAPENLADIFAALDELGVPKDFLSPAERAQELPPERDFMWDKPKR